MSNISISPLDEEYIEGVYFICTKCFSIPWSKESIKNELSNNLFSNYLGAFIEDKLVGFIGMWAIVNEGEITNIAVLPEYQNKGVGAKLLKKLIKLSQDKKLENLYLEVRFSNLSAQSLYRKFGFKTYGLRKCYYSDNKENAILMSKCLLG
ncbi:MAG: ribosomal protein S18-alanine N-acetyltransferase [Oscillospiraceae bacterium]|nr:ribosomal protein S18-alanine N-acetyltransferase [Oscillospiraceae bacterium]